MSAVAEVDSRGWTTMLKEAVAARNEGLYRRTLMRFLETRASYAFVEALIYKPAALPVMHRSFRALAEPLGLSSPEDLVGWIERDEAAPRKLPPGARDVVAVALPYFRFALAWSRAVNKQAPYAVAVALVFFEPVVDLCEPAKLTVAAPVVVAPPVRESERVAASTPPSFARITQRA